MKFERNIGIFSMSLIEKIADEEPKATPKIPVVVNKWAGEDEDDPKVRKIFH